MASRAGISNRDHPEAMAMFVLFIQGVSYLEEVHVLTKMFDRAEHLHQAVHHLSKAMGSLLHRRVSSTEALHPVSSSMALHHR